MSNPPTNTTHLVVIAYSFPVFNREVDRAILSAPKLRKAYLQDREKELKGIRNRVEALIGDRCTPKYHNDVKWSEGYQYWYRKSDPGFSVPPPVTIEAVDSVDQFHVPFELI